MPLLSPSGSSPPLGSLPEVSSRRIRSPIFEHGGSSERIPVVDLSSNKEDLFLNTTWDEEFTRKLFNDLNRGLLGPLGDGNIIVLSDSNEEEEACEEAATAADAAPPSVVKSPAPTASTADADDIFEGC
jgi:hypothetical protein